ncbi:MAG TPA: penicillin-binding transpeptidase domain-containing protein [Corynebacterium sp.]|nr:penicillin-binding transpeptidase domain-containing protein [Corynebacterium sp.]
MNKSIRWGALFALLLTFILLVNITVVQAFREDEYAQNSLNPRGLYELQRTHRGQINAGGQVLASSAADENGYYDRSYPTLSVEFAPILGYLSNQYGAAGLESSFNGVLSGTDSAVAATRWLDSLTGEERRGANLELTVDPNLQQLAYNQLTQNGYEGAAVALRPSTGAVLALASSPSYDPNLIANSETASEAWGAVNNAPGDPLINTATQDPMPPGSIFKIITTAAGLEAGYTPDSQVTGVAEITLPDTVTTLTNYAGQSCGGSDMVSLATAFALSCNTAFVEMSTNIGTEGLRSTAEAFGVGETYDLGVQMAPGGTGEMPDAAATAQSSIGQRDVTMSALQAAVMAATVANDGRRMAPYLVDSITSPDLKVLEETKPEEITQAISPEQAATLEQLMFASERSTSGYNGNGYASKTGTAEHGDGSVGPHAWYVAYDPANDVAVAVVVKNGGGYGSSATGGQLSAPIGRAMLAAAPRAAGGGA